MTTPTARSQHTPPSSRNADLRVALVTGGAGFIGSNLVARLLRDGETRVRVFDDLSRAGTEHNLAWLRTLEGSRLEIVHGDVRDAAAVQAAARDAAEIYHLAAQVAVTTSVDQPRTDFEINAGGTFNVLEAARRSGRRPFLLFTSTNKVYGGLHNVPVERHGIAYRAADPAFRGVTEAQVIDFHSPYGCSKGAADQYVRDYARIYDLPTVVFRMSCIAGPRQFGNEDQGWVAHFLYSVLARSPITIYGDGCQVRDILHVDDLLDAMQAVSQHRSTTEGEIFNVGGGLGRAVSVRSMLAEIESQTGLPVALRYSAMRPGDQPLYISDTTKLEAATGWRARRSMPETVAAIHEFWRANQRLLQAVRSPSPTRELISEEVA